jgi:hypothetical protein
MVGSIAPANNPSGGDSVLITCTSESNLALLSAGSMKTAEYDHSARSSGLQKWTTRDGTTTSDPGPIRYAEPAINAVPVPERTQEIIVSS